jgi:hypothetical protein
MVVFLVTEPALYAGCGGWKGVFLVTIISYDLEDIRMNYRISVAVGVAAFSLLLGACASSSGQETANNNRPHEVCSYQSALGSHIGSRECMSRSTYKAQQAAQHKQAQSQADQNTGGPPPKLWR